MDSHILNTFHQANYRGIGHRTARESSSSECSSGNHTSPEHIRNRQQQQYKDTNEDVWRNSSQKVTMHQIQETSSDEEQEPHNETSSDDEHPSLQQILNRNAPNAYQYDLITIIPVDPNAESSDEDEPDHSVEIHHEVTVPSNEVVYEDSVDESEYMYVQHMPNDAIDYMSQEVFNPNDHVVSNVDEYFVKDNKDGILDVEDKPVVLDVDAFFVKNDKPQPQVEEDYCETIIKSEPAQFGPNKLPLDQADEPIRVEDFFNAIPRKPELHVQNQINTEAPLSYLNAGPTIEDIKHYLQGDIPNLKTRHKSFSLPQSPHLDIDDPKTSISFEDVTEYIEGCRDSSEICTLTDEDVNSFLITNNQAQSAGIKDELSSDEMEIASPVHNPVTVIHSVPALLDFCIEKPAVKKEPIVERTMKVEPEDFVDVESCNDAAIPVIEANSLSSLLEQYEATEKANTKPKKIIVKNEDIKLKPATLTSGNSQQDAKMHMNKNKMRQIVVPPVGGPVVRRSSSPARLDHDYCTSKRQKSLPVIRGGQSLLKPEVLSSNNKILSSRHRACKNKKVVYHESDEESENKNKNKKTNKSDDSDVVFNSVKKASLKSEKVMPNAIRKKPSPVHSVINDFKVKGNDTVMVNDASKARDNPNSQTCNGRIKLTIKNKSEVILSCDVKDSQKDKVIEKSNPSSVNKPVVIKSEIKDNIQTKVTKLYKEEEIKNIKVEEVDKNKFVKTVKVEESEKIKIVKHVKDEEGEKQKNVNKPVQNNKEESRPKVENLYTGLITNKKDVHIPVGMKAKKEKRTFEEELTMASKVEAEQPQKKKKLNLQEYKMRRGVSSNNSSTAVSPESIFPEMPSAPNLDKTKSVSKKSSSNGVNTVTVQATKEVPKKMFDPIMEASRKILMNTKKQKAAAMRKRDEDIVMRKIPKVENLELQPLMSEADMMKMVGMAPVEAQPAPVVEKPQAPAEYDEIVMVSAGTCTDENVFRQLQKPVEKTKSLSPVDTKNLINFKIKKSDQILKKNVFESHSSHSRQEESHKRDKKSPTEDKRNTDIKINKERLRDITATLKSVEKNVDKKIPSNSLFANIKNLVLKKSPEEEKGGGGAKRRLKSDSPKREDFRRVKTAIVREYDTKTEHGEDKVILHLGKNRTKPESAHRAVQTDQSRPKKTTESSGVKRASPPIAQTNRKRTESDMSMSSEGSPVRPKESSKVDEARRKPASNVKRSRSKEKRSRSTERHDKYKRSRSPARAQKRKRSPSRSRSRSRGYRRYRRSDSPYRRRRRSRSRSRSHYHSRRSPSHRRSPSPRRDYRRPKFDAAPARPAKKSASPPKVNGAEKAPPKKSMTPPPRKPTVSESSDSSSSSSSSSSTSTSSSSSEESRPRRSVSPYRQEYRNEYKAYSGDDREKQSVEERRIVFVGKLENDITKSRLRSQFVQFGPIIEVRLHSKEDGSRYGFVTFQRPRDAWTAVESHSKFPYYDIGFGGRRAFCGHKYADLDGLEAKYTESAFHGMPVAPRLPTLTLDDDVMTFDDLLSDVREKITQRKSDNPTTSDEP